MNLLDRRDRNLGGIYENAVAQALAVADISLWYYASEGTGEVDFLMEGVGGRVVPIEVKSGRKVRGHAALDKLLSTHEYRIRVVVVLSRNNNSREGPVLYASFCLEVLCEREGDGFTFAPAAISVP